MQACSSDACDEGRKGGCLFPHPPYNKETIMAANDNNGQPGLAIKPFCP